MLVIFSELRLFKSVKRAKFKNWLKSHPKVILRHVKMGTFAKSGHFQVQKNGTSGAQTKILRPLLKAQHPPKMMKLPFVLSVYHFWMGLQPIC